MEHAIALSARSTRYGNEADWESYFKEDHTIDLDALNRDMVECHAQVLWKPPSAYLRISNGMKEALDGFYHDLSSEQRNH